MSPRFELGLENVPCIAEVVNRSLKADCRDFKQLIQDLGSHAPPQRLFFNLFTPNSSGSCLSINSTLVLALKSTNFENI